MAMRSSGTIRLPRAASSHVSQLLLKFDTNKEINRKRSSTDVFLSSGDTLGTAVESNSTL